MYYPGDTMNAVRFVVITNNLIVNSSCGDIKVGASYVKSLHKTKTMK